MDNKNARTSVENNLSVRASYQKRRYRAALHNVAVIHIPVAARFAAFRINAAVRHPHLKSGPGVSRSGAAGVIAPKLLRPWRWGFFWLLLVSAFRLSVALAVIGCGRRATLRPLLLLLVLLRRRRLSVSALHSFSLGARFTRISSTSRRRDLLMKSGRWTAARLLMFSCAQRRRRAGPYAFIFALGRSLSCPTMRGIWLLTWSSRWLATMFLLLRRCTLDT